MRIAVLGAAAAALLGGTLAVTPVTSVSTPMPTGGTCSNGMGGAGCEKLASVLMPEAPAPAAQQAPTPFPEAGNVIAPGVAPEPSGPAAANIVPGVATGPGVGGGAPVIGGAVVPGADLGALPNVNLGGIPDPYAVIPGVVPAVAAAAGLAAAPRGAFVAMSLIRGVVGIGTSVMSTAYMGAIAAVYLKNAGLLPSNIGLPSLSIPGLSNVTNAVAAVPALASIPGAAAALPSVSLPKVGLPAAPALPALPAVGLPAAPALPALPAIGLPAAPALPAVGLPAPPRLPGPPAIPHPRLCTPSLGPIGACTP
jgi:hypothetical protein